MVRDAHFADNLMADDGEILDAQDQAADTGTLCRIRVRGTEGELDVPGFTTNPRTDEYVIKIRKSEAPSLTENQFILNRTTGDRYAIIEPPILSGRDRDEWMATCRLILS